MQRILSYMRKAIEEYNMIEENDKIAICLSGGKDSITLLHAFKALQRFYPKHFDLIAITVNPGFENFNKDILQKNCDEIGVPLFIEDTQIKEIVFDVRKEKNPCSLCANLRRGIINSVAIREGCNKIALGHNKDDVLETFLLNLLYAGSINTFAPVSYMDRSKITLIRPLIYAEEKDTRRFIKIDFKLPVLLGETAVLVTQSILLLKYDGTLWVYIIEVLLVVVMLLLNLKPIKELVNLILAKFLKKRKN